MPSLRELPRRRRAFVVVAASVSASSRPEELRHAEVENLDAIVVGNHHVAGLQIAVQNSGGMRARQALGDLSGDSERLRERQWRLSSQELAQAPAIDTSSIVMNDQAISFFHGVEVDDVGMVEGGRRSGFSSETARGDRSKPPRRGRGSLSATRRSSLRVLGDIHVAHAAAAEPRQDDVVAELFADHIARSHGRAGKADRRECALAALAASSFRRAAVPDARPALRARPRVVQRGDALQRSLDFAIAEHGRGCHGPRRSASRRRLPPGS